MQQVALKSTVED